MQRNWNHWRMEPEEVKRRLIQAKLQLAFSVEIYQYQLSKGRHFLHEHPASAASWEDDEVNTLRQLQNVQTVTGHLCQYGMTQTDKDGETRHVFKPTRWMSSAPELIKRLGRKCGRTGPNGCRHRHTILFGKA